MNRIFEEKMDKGESDETTANALFRWEKNEIEIKF